MRLRNGDALLQRFGIGQMRRQGAMLADVGAAGHDNQHQAQGKGDAAKDPVGPEGRVGTGHGKEIEHAPESDEGARQTGQDQKRQNRQACLGDAGGFDPCGDFRRAKFSTRQVRRCAICGRPRAVYRKFTICRICFRDMALDGLIPGVKKASW